MGRFSLIGTVRLINLDEVNASTERMTLRYMRCHYIFSDIWYRQYFLLYTFGLSVYNKMADFDMQNDFTQTSQNHES